MRLRSTCCTVPRGYAVRRPSEAPCTIRAICRTHCNDAVYTVQQCWFLWQGQFHFSVGFSRTVSAHGSQGMRNVARNAFHCKRLLELCWPRWIKAFVFSHVLPSVYVCQWCNDTIRAIPFPVNQILRNRNRCERYLAGLGIANCLKDMIH